MIPVVKRFVLVFAALALMLPVLAACNGDEDGDDAADTEETEEVEDDETTEDEASEDDVAATEEEANDEDEATDGLGEGQTIEVGLIEWAEAIAVTHLWAVLLENEGFNVEITTLEAAGLFTGLAQGDLDVYLDAWLPTTHEQYWNEFGDELERIGPWYEEAVLALTVPQYVADEGVTSIADLQDNADMFDSTITGIDPGAGMMGIARDTVMPTYGLEDWDLTESSEAGMLSELERAYSDEEPIVVTLWEPHWAYAEYELQNLEDPENAWGEPDSTVVIGREGFSEDFPEVAQWLENFEFEAEEIGELMNYVAVEAEAGEERQAAQQWLDDGGQEIVDAWMN